jgi:putative hydrolase of the HAD superfamily
MNDTELKEMILDRFILRKWMMDVIDKLGKNNIRLAILSDQTNWLDELEKRDHFFHKFKLGNCTVLNAAPTKALCR